MSKYLKSSLQAQWDMFMASKTLVTYEIRYNKKKQKNQDNLSVIYAKL